MRINATDRDAIVDTPLDPAVQALLLPDEQVLWTDGLDTSYLRNDQFQSSVIFAGAVILALAGIVYFLGSGSPENFDILALIETVVIVAAIPLVILAGITLIRLRRRARSTTTARAPDL